MKQKLTTLVVSLSLAGITVLPINAAIADQATDVSKLTQQVAALQKKVNALESKHVYSKKSKTSHHKVAVTKVNPTNKNIPENSATSLTYFPMDISVPGKSFVSSGPYIGIPLEYSGGNLIINASSVNQDIALLKVRKNIDSHLSAMGIEQSPSSTHLLLSGIVEGQAKYDRVGGDKATSDMDITSAGLDAYVLGPGPWLSSLIAFSYDNGSGTSSGSFDNHARAQNSRVYLSQAFVTIGNLTKTPFYGTFGQFTVPFGTYSSNMVSTPLTKELAGTKARAILFGYNPQTDNTVYAAGYLFKGDSHTGTNNKINNGGANVGYKFTYDVVKADIGGGMIANIADSIGMQNVANSSANFNGFGGVGATGNEQIVHRVPAYNLRGVFGIGEKVNVLAEYVAATTQFSQADLTMNNHGAKPKALNTEASYTFSTFSHPSSVAVGYAMTKDALALGLPAQRYSLVYNTSIWRDTLQSLEFRHEVNYAGSATATGSTVNASAESGKSDNILTAQFDVYF